MRRLLLPLALVALPLTGATPASANCAEPQDGPPTCCPPRYLLVVDEPPFSIYVPDPTWSPAECARIV